MVGMTKEGGKLFSPEPVDGCGVPTKVLIAFLVFFPDCPSNSVTGALIDQISAC